MPGENTDSSGTTTEAPCKTCGTTERGRSACPGCGAVVCELCGDAEGEFCCDGEGGCAECACCHGYGYYPGGDPRHFHPDEECCTPAEIAAHKAACEAWERGETPDPGGPHLPLTEENIAKYAPSVVVKHGAGGHITVAHYGIGTYDLPCSVHGYTR